MENNECVFCRIIRKESPARIIYQDKEITAFWDQIPATPVHILIVPNRHIQSVSDLQEKDADLVGRMALLAKRLALQENIEKSGYRLVINSGEDAGQTVHHLHMHLIGGRPMAFRKNL